MLRFIDNDLTSIRHNVSSLRRRGSNFLIYVDSRLRGNDKPQQILRDTFKNLQIGMQMRIRKNASKRKCTLPYMRIARVFSDKQDAPEMGVFRSALRYIVSIWLVIALPAFAWNDKPEPFKIFLIEPLQVPYVGLMVAEQQGYFAKQNITTSVGFPTRKRPVDPIKMLTEKYLDVVIVPEQVFYQAVLDDKPITAIGILAAAMGHQLIIRPNQYLSNPIDLLDKNIGYDGGNALAALKLWLFVENVPFNRIKAIPIEDGGAKTFGDWADPPLRALMAPPYRVVNPLTKAGIEYQVWPRLYPEVQLVIITYQKHPNLERLQAFLTALGQAHQALRRDSRALEELLSRNPNLKGAFANGVTQTLAHYNPQPEQISLKTMTSNMALFQMADVIARQKDLTEYVTPHDAIK
jgi:hypothetical protein